VTARSTEAPGDQPRKRGRWALSKSPGKWVVFLAALGVLVIGLVLLRYVWHGKPVAAAFTRVGGETHVETAVEASRFWLTSPQVVVTTQADADQQIMLGAAHCAMVHDAPLLFTSRDPKRQRLVYATINNWRNNATTKRPARLEVINVRSQRDVTRCLANGDPADINGLSTLAVPHPLLQLPEIPTRQTLAPVVVFAAAWEPGFLPDVAVGLALGAHMATPYHAVSLVVVPRYLDSAFAVMPLRPPRPGGER
jgi:hypothetical protein